MPLKRDAPSRSARDVGKGDFIKVRGQWLPIESNTATGADRPPRDGWTVRTTDGGSYGMYDAQRYAKAEDME